MKKKEVTQISLNWNYQENQKETEIKNLMFTYLHELTKPDVSEIQIQEMIQFFDHFFSQNQETVDNLRLCYSTKMLIVSCISSLLKRLYQSDLELFYFLAQLFFNEGEKKLSYDANHIQDTVDQGEIGILRSLYLILEHQKIARSLKPKK